MKHPRTNLVSFIVLLTSMSASADFVGLNIGAHYWTPDLTGSFNSTTTGSDTVNRANDLGINDKQSKSLTISFEHPVPMLPNIKFQGYDLSSSSSTSGSTVIFKGETYSGNINSNLDLSHNDIALYYKLLDNWVNLDLGLDLKMFDGRVSIVDDVNPVASSIPVDETIPMLYLSARFDLPFTGLYVGADIHPFSIGDSTAEDSTLKIGYQSKAGLGIEGGFKTFSLELEDANKLNTNLEYDGIYFNGFYNF